MNSMNETAKAESRAAFLAWEVGGSDLYPPKMTPRPRPKREPVREANEPGVEVPMAFDEALEHVAWCRERNMSPQCVIDSIGDRAIGSTWGMALAVVEQDIIRMRIGKPKC